MTTKIGSISAPASGYYLDEWTVRTQERRKSDDKILLSNSATPGSDGSYTIESPDLYSRFVKIIPEQPLGSDWQASTAYSLGDYVHPTTFAGYVFRCTTAGTSGGTEPTWDETHGNTTSDNTVTWTAIAYLGEAAGEGKFWQGEFDLDADLAATLLGGSTQGAIYDISDTSTLWQDTAGTSAVTADGDLVARVDDLSGNNHHLLQGTSGSRPIYRTDGTYHWLEFDGSDDFLSVGTSTTFMDGGGFMGVSFSSYLADDYGVVFEESETANSGDRVLIYADTRTTPNRHSFYYANSGTIEQVNFSEKQNPYPVVLTLNTDGTTGSGYKNGVLIGTLGASDNFSGNTTIFVGRQAVTGTGASFKGRLYRAVITDDEQTTANREVIERWLSEGTGISL